MNRIEELELKIAKLLRFGVIFSGAIIFAGWLYNLKWSADPFFGFEIYGEMPLKDIVEIYYRNQNWGMLTSYVGLSFLISLPLIRVLLTSWLFFKEKDFLLATIALVVFIALIASFFLGIEL